MSGSGVLNYMMGAVFILLAALRFKKDCPFCFTGLVVLALIFLIFGIFKWIRQRNG